MIYWLIPGLLVVVLGVSAFFYRPSLTRSFNLPSEKVRPRVSVVFITKNNEKLLEHTIKILLKFQKDIHEIVVLDLGSIDKTLEVAQHVLDKNTKAIIRSISRKTIKENYFNLIKNYVSGETVYVLDLYKIGVTNPNIYIPDLFKHLNSIQNKGLPQADTRIDGSKLLLFDAMEREKNNFVIKEYIMETMANVHMRLDSCKENIKKNPEDMESNMSELLEYMDQSTKNVALLTRLIGPGKFLEQTLDDNMLTIFKNYSHSHQVTINYKVIGKEKIMKETVRNLMLGITQDLLYTIVQYNLSSSIDVQVNYKRKKLFLFFKYDWAGDESKILSTDSGLSYYVLNSIKNRLSLLGGHLNIKTNSKQTVNILMYIPLDETTCEYPVEEKNENKSTP